MALNLLEVRLKLLLYRCQRLGLHMDTVALSGYLLWLLAAYVTNRVAG